MATKQNNTTHEELAKQFQITGRPFAVWFNAEPEAVNNRPWALNDKSGEATQEFDDLETALKAAAEIGKEWAEEARIQAHALARISGDAEANLTDADRKNINHRLEDIYHSLRAIRELAISARDSDQQEHYLTAIEEMSRSNIKGLDACIGKLHGHPYGGNFATEFDQK